MNEAMIKSIARTIALVVSFWLLVYIAMRVHLDRDGHIINGVVIRCNADGEVRCWDYNELEKKRCKP